MFKKFFSVFTLTICILLLTISASYGALNWKYYYNSRFGYALEYPGNIFYMEESYENLKSQGIIFKPYDSWETRFIKVDAKLNPVSVSLEELYYDRIYEYESRGAYITYKPLDSTSFTLSGFESNGDIFYLKHISRSIGGGEVVDVWFTARYPEKDRSLFDGILEHLVNTFRFCEG